MAFARPVEPERRPGPRPDDDRPRIGGGPSAPAKPCDPSAPAILHDMADQHAGTPADLELLAAEGRDVLGAPPATVDRLDHSKVTRGVWRVRAGDVTAVVKVLARPAADDAAAVDPASIRYWLREAQVYSGGVPEPYRDAGVRCPALLARTDRPDGDVAIWMEDVTGETAGSWAPEAFERAMRRLGRAQGAYLAGTPLPDRAWLCRDFLRRYLASRRPEYDQILASDAAWRHPAVARHFDRDLRDGLRRLRADRERLLGWVDAAPRTFAHLDVWPDNLVARRDELVLLDWGFAGIGAAGEDPGNAVPDSMFDLRQPVSRLPDLDRTITAGYLAGLRDAGWDGDERLIRLGMRASTACKYDWIAGATLWRAAQETATQPIYGGVQVEAEVLFATRAAIMRHLLGWADEARSIARELGLTA
jgi:hypothetical protein